MQILLFTHSTERATVQLCGGSNVVENGDFGMGCEYKGKIAHIQKRCCRGEKKVAFPIFEIDHCVKLIFMNTIMTQAWTSRSQSLNMPFLSEHVQS